MHNFSFSKLSSAASSNTVTSGSSQLGTVTEQRPRGSFVGLPMTIHMPESTLLPANYNQQCEPRPLSDTRLWSLWSGTNASQADPVDPVDPFELLATYQTVTCEDPGQKQEQEQEQEQEQSDEFPLPFDELLQPVDDFDPMLSEDPDEVSLSILPNNLDDKIRIRTTISIPRHEILPSINDHFRQALSGIMPEAVLVGITGDPKLPSSQHQAYQWPDSNDLRIMWSDDKTMPFKCAYESCGRKYTNKSALQTHLSIHTDDMHLIPIAVSNSGYSRCAALESTCLEKFEDTIGIRCSFGDCAGIVRYPDKQALFRHVRAKHTFERFHQCEFCDKRFRRIDVLKYHSDSCALRRK